MKSVVEDIKKGSFKPVYLFYGEEAYLKQQYKNRLKNAVLPEGDTINLSIYSGKGIDVKEMIAQADFLRTLISSWQNTSRPYQRKPSCCLWKVK